MGATCLGRECTRMVHPWSNDWWLRGALAGARGVGGTNTPGRRQRPPRAVVAVRGHVVDGSAVPLHP